MPTAPTLFFAVFTGLIMVVFSYAGQASTPPDMGNFSLPDSQQPGPLYSFGQFTVDKNQVQAFLNPSYIAGVEQYYLTLIPIFVYGVTDNLALLLSPPLAIKYHEGSNESSGLEDTMIQAEYTFFQNSNKRYVAQASIVSGITIPTGSLKKDPPTGFGSSSFFTGATYNQMYVDWYWFVSPGFQWTKPNQLNHMGSIYFYEAGAGKNLIGQTNQYSWFALIELNGVYFEQNKTLGMFDPNSGGNIIFISPSLLYATEKLYLQFGIALPILQHLNGMQNKINYNASLAVAWTFN